MGTPIEASPRETCRRSCSGISRTPAVPKMLPMMTLCDSHAMAPILSALESTGRADSTSVSACSMCHPRPLPNRFRSESASRDVASVDCQRLASHVE